MSKSAQAGSKRTEKPVPSVPAGAEQSSMRGADIVIKCLELEGVKVVFASPVAQAWSCTNR